MAGALLLLALLLSLQATMAQPDEGVLLHTAQMMVAHGELVSLSYDLGGPPGPAADGDFLFLYSPSTADPQRTAPFRIARAADDAAYAATGTGTRRIQLEGLRADVAVYFVRGVELKDRWWAWMTGARPTQLLLGGRLASRALVLDFDSRTTPLWPRVLSAQAAAAADGDSLRVAWQGDGSERSPVLQWGFTAGQFTGQAAAGQQAIAADALCGDVPGWVDPRGNGTPGTLVSAARGAGFSTALGVTFSALLTGLRAHAGRRVYYRVGDGATPRDEGMSRTYTLQLPPLPGDASAPFVILAGADWGAAPGDDSVAYHGYSVGARNVSAAIAAEATAGRAHAVIAAGDLAYSDGYLPAWNTWLSQTASFSSALPLFVAGGNHEHGYPTGGATLDADVIASGGECGVPLHVLYPQPPPWAPPSPWTSTRLGPACLLAVSTEHPLAPGSPQHAWLARELAAMWDDDNGDDGAVGGEPPQPRCPWIIGVLHRPLFIDSDAAASPSQDAPVMAALQAHVDPLFRHYRVNLVISGHNHRYERNCVVDVAAQRCELRGRPVTLEGGAAEVALYEQPDNAVHIVVGASGAPFDFDAPGRFFVDKELLGETGYARIAIVNGSHMAVDYTAPDGRVLDRFLITQQWPRLRPHGAPPGGGGSDGGASPTPSSTPVPSPTAVVPAFDDAPATPVVPAAEQGLVAAGDAPQQLAVPLQEDDYHGTAASTGHTGADEGGSAAAVAGGGGSVSAGADSGEREEEPIADDAAPRLQEAAAQPGQGGGSGVDEERGAGAAVGAPPAGEGEPEGAGAGGGGSGGDWAEAAAPVKESWEVVDGLDTGAGRSAPRVDGADPAGAATTRSSDGGKLVLLILVALAGLVVYRHSSTTARRRPGGGAAAAWAPVARYAPLASPSGSTQVVTGP